MVVYLYVNCGFSGCLNYNLDFIYVVDLYFKLGDMINIEEFWMLEKNKIIFSGLGLNGELVEMVLENE